MKNNRFLIYLGAVLAGLILAVIIQFVFHPVIVAGHSMEPTYFEGDILFCSRIKEHQIKRGDIVVFYNERMPLIKRVVGLPGETIYTDETNRIMVDGKMLNVNSYGLMEYSGLLDGSLLTLGENEYFCLGDNRNESMDSRDLGPINIEKIKYVVN